jgi:hypothetical protein
MADKPVNLAGRCHWCAERWRLRHPHLVTAARYTRTCLAAAARQLLGERETT